MRVIIHASDLPAERMLVQALGGDGARRAGVEISTASHIAEFRTALYRDRDAIGVLWTRVRNYARRTVKDFRADGIHSPIIVLLDDGDAYEHIAKRSAAFAALLGIGADDVQTTPIDGRELLERVRALARRERPPVDALLLPNDAVYRPGTGKIFFDGGFVWLTGKESALVELLTSRPGVVFSKEMILDGLYGGRPEPDLKIVDVFICKLRKKILLALDGQDIIETVWGRGYRYVPEGFTPIISDNKMRRVG